MLLTHLVFQCASRARSGWGWLRASWYGVRQGRGAVVSPKADIGRWCPIGFAVQIGPTKHDITHASTSPVLQRRFQAGRATATAQPPPPQIGHDVWLGSGA